MLQPVTTKISLLGARVTVSKPTVVKPVQRGPIAVAAPTRGALSLPLWRSKVNVLDKKVANLHFSDQKKKQARNELIRKNKQQENKKYLRIRDNKIKLNEQTQNKQ